MASFIQKQKNKKRIILVGSGISGLMDAFALNQVGFTVEVYSKGPDPRDRSQKDYSSSTHNGELGRFISRFEGEHYLGSSPMYPDMEKAFRTHVENGGWLGKHANELNTFDKAWLLKRAEANTKEKEMLEIEKFYVSANGKAMILWNELIKNFPEIFKNTDLLNTGITRLYDREILLNWAVRRHQKEKALERALNQKEVIKEYPYFAEAAELGYIAGAVEAPGFSFNIHKFTSNLISYLENSGATFFWSKCIYRIKFTKNKLVEGLVTDAGMIKADGYSLNPGAYAEEGFFKGTSATGKVAGVAGRWMFIPAPKNFKRPVKIHGDSRIENGKQFPIVDINLTHFKDKTGKEWLAVGGGYAYLGKPPYDKTNSALEAIDAENERTISRILGPTYRQAKIDGFIKKSDATCVRSFTYDDMPIMDNMAATNKGILRINVGTNTGTTTISPFTAMETVKTFRTLIKPY
jgi:glycine/D-amino acid oxidase-like deaminating enzyme